MYITQIIKINLALFDTYSLNVHLRAHISQMSDMHMYMCIQHFSLNFQ